MSDTAKTILKLSAAQLARLVDTLAEAFTPGELTLMLPRRLNRSFNNYLMGTKYSLHVYYLVQDAQDVGWLGDLLAAALDEKPQDVKLQAFLAELDGNANLESAMKGSALIDFGRLEQVTRWVCQIQGGGIDIGTGILIGPDLILTNGHVLNDINTKAGGISQTQAVFDHRFVSGVEISNARNVAFDPQWAPLHRPYNPLEAMPEQTQPANHELDYAVLRLQAPVGNQPVGDPAKALAGAPPRGWLRLPDPAVPAPSLLPLPGRMVIIVQHPKTGAGTQLKVASGQAMTSPWPALRFRYSVTTLGGSSGSPCFDDKFQLVALHHASDGSTPPLFNQAIPLPAILQDFLTQAAAFTSQGSMLPWTFGPPVGHVPPPPPSPPQPGPSPAPMVRPNIMDAVVLGTPPRIFFVNRSKLRSHLQSLTATPPVDYRIVSVRGNPQSGKKHSRHLIEHEAGEWAVNCTYFDAAIPQSMAESCQFIAEQMGFSAADVAAMEQSVSEDKADPARMARKFARWLARSTAAQKPTRWWLILDSLHPSKNPVPELRDHLVGGLVEEMRTNKLFTQVVVFMIGSAPPADGYLLTKTLDDEIGPLTTGDLTKFFETYAKTLGKQLRSEESSEFVKAAVGAAQGSLSAQQMNSLQADLARAIGGFSV